MPLITDNATVNDTQDTSLCVDIYADVEAQCNATSAVTPDNSTAGHYKSTATDIDSKSWQSIMQSLSTQQQIITMLRSEIKSCKSPAAKMEGDDKQNSILHRTSKPCVYLIVESFA